MKKKIIAYIIRENNNQKELLVHQHRDFPEAGIQVPAGTVEDGEAVEDALFREIAEESGLTNLSITRKLGEYIYFNEYKGENQERHVFLLTINHCVVAEQWTHIVTGGGEDEGLYFCYSWKPIETVHLAANQGDFLNQI